MIIDCNAHLGYWPFRDVKNSQPDEFVALMDGCGVTQACVAPFQGILYNDVRPANDWLAEHIQPYGDRLIPNATINPNFPLWEKDLEEAVAMGFSGVRLYPDYHSYELGDGCLSDLMAAVDAAGLSVGIHARMYDMRLHHPRCIVPAAEVGDAGKLAARFPGVPIILCNLKTAEINGVTEDVKALSNLYVEISNLEGPGGVAKLAATVGAEKVLFGTHAPYQYMDSSLLKMQEAELSEDDAAAIFYGNMVKILA